MRARHSAGERASEQQKEEEEEGLGPEWTDRVEAVVDGDGVSERAQDVGAQLRRRVGAAVAGVMERGSGQVRALVRASQGTPNETGRSVGARGARAACPWA